MRKLILISGLIALFANGASAADTTGTWTAAAAGRLDSISGYSWSPAAPAGFTSDVILVFTSASSNQNATLKANINIKQLAVNTNYTGTIALQTYTMRIDGGGADLGGATLNAGSSTVKFLGTSGTLAIVSRGESWYDVYDSTLSTATLSTSDNLSCHTFTKYTTSTGALTFAGDSVYCSGDFVIDGASSPALTLGTAVALGGASSQFHIGSGVGTTTASSCNLYMNTATAGVIDVDKSGVSMKALAIDGVVTNTGLGEPSFITTTLPLTLQNNSTLTQNKRLNFQCTQDNSTAYSLPASYTINGTNSLYFYAGASGISVNYPAITSSGTAQIYFTANSSNDTLNQTGSVSTSGEFGVVFSTSTSGGVFNSGNYSITTTGNLLLSSNNSVDVLNFGSSTVSCGTYGAGSGTTGTHTLNAGTSTIVCSGNFLFSNNAGYTFNGGTGIIRITGATGSVTSLRSKLCYSLEIAKTSAAVDSIPAGDTLKIGGNLTLTSGKFRQPSNSPIQITGNYSRTGTDTVSMRGQKNIGGDMTLAAGVPANLGGDTTLTIFDGAGNSVITLNGATVGRTRIKKTTSAATVTIADNGQYKTIIDSVGILRITSASVTITVDSILSLDDSVHVAAGNTVNDSGSLIMGANAKPNLLGTIALLGAKAQAITGIGSKSFGRVTQNKAANGATVTGASRYSHLTISDGDFLAADTVYITDTLNVTSTDSIYAPVVRLLTSRARLALASLTKNGIAKIVVDSCGATVNNLATYKTPIYYPKVGPFLYNPASVTCTVGVAIANMTVTNNGCPADSFNATATLPTGLSVALLTGTISGTITAGLGSTTAYIRGYNSLGTVKDSTLVTFIIVQLQPKGRRTGLTTGNGLIIGTD